MLTFLSRLTIYLKLRRAFPDGDRSAQWRVAANPNIADTLDL